MNKRTARHLPGRVELTARGWAALGMQVTARDLAQDALHSIGFDRAQVRALALAGYGVQLRQR